MSAKILLAIEKPANLPALRKKLKLDFIAGFHTQLAALPHGRQETFQAHVLPTIQAFQNKKKKTKILDESSQKNSSGQTMRLLGDPRGPF